MRQSGRDLARSWLDVDLDALRRNARSFGAHAGVPLVPMVKADAYGLGAVPVVQALESLGPWGYGIAAVDEGEALRASGVERPLLVFTPLLPESFRAARAARITPVLGDPESIASWVDSDPLAAWHLGIDTGMSRAGVRWDRVGSVAELVRRSPPAGACTHFHSAERDDHSQAVQGSRFREALSALRVRPALLHAENSAAVSRHGPSEWDLARPGIFLYGVDVVDGAPLRAEPVVALRARIVELRQLCAGDSVSYDATYRAADARRIATAAVGYGDGYRRALGNRGTAVVNGRSAPVVGLVTMDMTMLDVTAAPCRVGDVATFIDGHEPELGVAAVARRADVSPYELLVGLRLRAARRYHASGA